VSTWLRSLSAGEGWRRNATSSADGRIPHVAEARRRRSWTRHSVSLLDSAARCCVSACCGHGGAAQTAVIAGLGRRLRAMRRASSGRCPRVRGHQNAAGRSRGRLGGSGKRMMAFKRVRGCCGRVVEAGEGCVVRREASVPRHVNARERSARRKHDFLPPGALPQF
jgi:hypothetical protein